jgi:hypothetical protein
MSFYFIGILSPKSQVNHTPKFRKERVQRFQFSDPFCFINKSRACACLLKVILRNVDECDIFVYTIKDWFTHLIQCTLFGLFLLPWFMYFVGIVIKMNILWNMFRHSASLYSHPLNKFIPVTSHKRMHYSQSDYQSTNL